MAAQHLRVLKVIALLENSCNQKTMAISRCWGISILMPLSAVKHTRSTGTLGAERTRLSAIVTIGACLKQQAFKSMGTS